MLVRAELNIALVQAVASGAIASSSAALQSHCKAAGRAHTGVAVLWTRGAGIGPGSADSSDLFMRQSPSRPKPGAQPISKAYACEKSSVLLGEMPNRA